MFSLEFGYGSVVVELVALSNGLTSPERLYSLDLVRTEESLLWNE